MAAGRRLAGRTSAVVMLASALALACASTAPSALPAHEPEVARVSSHALRHHTGLRPQIILNKIHDSLHSGDHTQNGNCHIGGYNPFPHVPCRHDRVRPTSASLNPDGGGFRTDCRDPYISTYHYYKISPLGQAFRTCGPLTVWPKKSTFGEFTKPLSTLGDMIQSSVKLHYPEATTGIAGNRAKVTAHYECPGPVSGQNPGQPNPATTEGVKAISIDVHHRALVTLC
jgi:hypothetical protein